MDACRRAEVLMMYVDGSGRLWTARGVYDSLSRNNIFDLASMSCIHAVVRHAK